ncbi:MAG: hypothetical protein ABUK01_00020 [Leptospirales bacterium]
MFDYNEQIYVKKKFIKSLIDYKEVDSFSMNSLNTWLSSSNLSEKEEYYILNILSRAQYYNEAHLIKALHEILNNKIIPHIEFEINHRLVDEYIDKPLSYSENKYKTILKKTAFIPLLDRNKPNESSNGMMRLLTNNGIINESQCCFLDEIIGNELWNEFDYFVIFDDSIGTGGQLLRFLNLPEIETLRMNLKTPEHMFFACILAIYKGLNNVSEYINVLYCDYYGPEFDVFSKDSIYWRNDSERDTAYAVLNELCKNRGITIKGRRRLAYAIFIAKTTPNWTLPIFWRELNNGTLTKRRST